MDVGVCKGCCLLGGNPKLSTAERTSSPPEVDVEVVSTGGTNIDTKTGTDNDVSVTVTTSALVASNVLVVANDDVAITITRS